MRNTIESSLATTDPRGSPDRLGMTGYLLMDNLQFTFDNLNAKYN